MICHKCGNNMVLRFNYRNGLITPESFCKEDGTLIQQKTLGFKQTIIIQEANNKKENEIPSLAEISEFVSLIPCHYLPETVCSNCNEKQIQRVNYQSQIYYFCNGCKEISMAKLDFTK